MKKDDKYLKLKDGEAKMIYRCASSKRKEVLSIANNYVSRCSEDYGILETEFTFVGKIPRIMKLVGLLNE